MYKPSFAEQPKKAEASAPLKALFKINAGLRELQSNQPEPNQGAGTVAQQIEQQGIAALNQPSESGEAIQNIPDTPISKVAMQANIADQIKAAEQAQLQQQLMQMASQQPQQMARGGIAALSARNMKFNHGGVVGFSGEDQSSVPKAEEEKEQSWYEKFPEGSGIRKLGKFLTEQAKSVNDWEAKQRETRERLYPLPKIAPMDIPEIVIEGEKSPAAPAPVVAQAMPRQPAMQAPERAGLGSLASSLGKVDLRAFEADKKAALENLNKQILPQKQTPRQIGEANEAEAKAMGVDLYGSESKARIAALEKEFADQNAARTEANKSRGMDNLITMLTNSGGAPTLFAGLAKGAQASQAAERVQKAEDLVWGGKKLEFMDKINTQRELLNERNKAMMLGNIAASRQLDEAYRVGQNNIYKQAAEIYSNSMTPAATVAVQEAKNATDLAINQARMDAERKNREVMREGNSFAAIQSRITQNAQTSSNIVSAMQKNFDTKYEIVKGALAMGLPHPGGPQAQKAYEEARDAHNAAIAKEIKRAAEENYKLELFQWENGGKATGLPAPTNPLKDAGTKGNRPGYFVDPSIN
jgi:hypothetical protein